MQRVEMSWGITPSAKQKGIIIYLSSLIGFGAACYFKKLNRKASLIGAISSGCAALAIGLVPKPTQKSYEKYFKSPACVKQSLEELADKMGKQFPPQFSSAKKIAVGAYVQIDRENDENAERAQAFNNSSGNVQEAISNVIGQMDRLLPDTTLGMPRIGLLISCQDEEDQWHHMYGYDKAYNSDKDRPQCIEQEKAALPPSTPETLKLLFEKHQEAWRSEDPSKDPSIPSEGDIFIGVRVEHEGESHYFSQFSNKEHLSFWLTKVDCLIKEKILNFGASSGSKVFYVFSRRDGYQWQPIYTGKEYGIEGVKWAPDANGDEKILQERDRCFQRLQFLSPFREASWQNHIPLKCTAASVVIAVKIGEKSYNANGSISAYYSGPETEQEKIDQEKRNQRREDIDWLLMQALLRVQKKGAEGEVVGAHCILTYETEFCSEKWMDICASLNEKGELSRLDEVPEELDDALLSAQSTRRVTRLTHGLK
ncbi:MAG: hypothetical protein JSR80_05035 [Verrucomicrobia bacterium]|nr:hypothetical protein [Verrucomicrobiota bacterium]